MEKKNIHQIWENYQASFISLIIMFVLLGVAVVCHLYGWRDAPFQFLAACLGAGVTVIITNLLLVEQTKQQQKLQSEQNKAENERRNREKQAKENIQIRESKIDTYNKFLGELYSSLTTCELREDKMHTLRMRVFQDLVFYANADTLDSISQEISNLFGEADVKQSEGYARVANALRKELSIDDASNESEAIKTITDLWKAITPENYSSSNHVVVDADISEEESNRDSEKESSKKIPYDTAWHFAMLGDEQLDAIGEDKINELSLIEYEEEWRTNLLKQVGEHDIVFLFRRGGCGYIGAFKPLGWRIFDYNEQKETLQIFGQQEQVKPVNDDDVVKYDIYNGRGDGADLCSNLIVEPIAYTPDGVGNPGGVYRRTISRYDAGYAATLLEWFKPYIDKSSH